MMLLLLTVRHLKQRLFTFYAILAGNLNSEAPPSNLNPIKLVVLTLSHPQLALSMLTVEGVGG